MTADNSPPDEDKPIEIAFARLVSTLVAIREAENQATQGDGMRFLVARILKYKIEIRPREEGHNHPHFHITSPDFEGSYRIDNQQCLAGNIPRRHEKKIQIWASQNKSIFEAAWKRAHPISFEERRNIIE